MSTVYDRVLGDSSVEPPKLRPRTVGIAVIDGSDGPILSLSYQADFRCEEEMGCSKLRNAFAQAAPRRSIQYKANKHSYEPLKSTVENQQARLVLDDGRVAVFSTGGYMSNVDRQIDEALRYFEQASVDDGTAPAWFHFGDFLIVPLDRDETIAAIARELIDAAKAGALCAGAIGVNVFGRGFCLFDERDLSKADVKAAIQSTKDHAKRMKDLEPVADVVKAGPMKNGFGSAYYFLGNPRLNADGEVVYWLNGSSVRFANGRSYQPCGWYTLDDLVAERYMLPAAENADESFRDFDDSGMFRKVKLSDDEAQALLNERGLMTAVEGLKA